MKFGRIARTAAAVVALAGGLAAGGAGNGRWSPGTALAAPHTCANFQLLVKPITGQGAAGTLFIEYRIHDMRAGSCSLVGYPGAKLLDTGFNSLPTFVRRSPFPANGPGPSTVTLSRTHDAYFVLFYSDVPTGAEACPSATYLLITAPNDHLPVVAYAGHGPIAPCGGRVTVSPVAATKYF